MNKIFVILIVCIPITFFSCFTLSKKDDLSNINTRIDKNQGLEREDIEGVVKRYISDIKDCYEKELNRSPDLSGKVVAKWTIAVDGQVKNCSIRSDLDKPSVENCIRRHISRWTFPKPRNGKQVQIHSYPFEFSPI